MSTSRWPRLALLAVVGLFPGPIKRPLYRALFGYRIGRGVRVHLGLGESPVGERGLGQVVACQRQPSLIPHLGGQLLGLA